MKKLKIIVGWSVPLTVDVLIVLVYDIIKNFKIAFNVYQENLAIEVYTDMVDLTDLVIHDEQILDIYFSAVIPPGT